MGRRRWWIPGVLALLLVLGAVLLPPLIHLNRYQRRIAASLSQSLGRPVEFSGVRLELLPRPGFAISNFAVEEAPGFGAEPMLVCSEVSASVRLLSLWRGRLEISRISLDEPSLNLERNAEGYWNFGAVLTQASRAATAPTGQRTPGRELRFPYIEASGARVNFKYGDEKKPFSFLNANVAIWLQNPGEWRVRFQAAPVRTDLRMSSADTGEVRVEGSVRRAPDLNAMPLDLDASWTGAPMGQLTRLLSGEDYGWRGTAEVRTHLAGTPEDLLVMASGKVDGFRRAEFEPTRTLTLAGTCTSEYLRATGLLRALQCGAPVGSGTIALTGTVARITGVPQPDVAVAIRNVPVAQGFDLLQDIHHGFAEGAGAGGRVNGSFTLNPSGIGGEARIADFTLRAPGLEEPVTVPELKLTADGSQAARVRAAGATLVLDPVQVRLGAATPLGVSGRFTRDGFAIHLAGAAALARLLPLGAAYGLVPAPVQTVAHQGEAQMNLTVAGPWLMRLEDGVPVPAAVNGSLALKQTQLQPGYLRRPVHIETAEAAITGDEIAWSDIAARFGPMRFTGSLRMPLHCAAAAPCARGFDLSTAALDLPALVAALRGTGEPAVVRDLIETVEPTAPWPPFTGTFRAAKLILDSLTLQNVSGALTTESGLLRVDSFAGRALGGEVQGSGSVLRGGGYAVNLSASRLSVDALAALFRESWGGGTLDLTAALKLAGASPAALARSASGTMRWDWSGGSWSGAAQTPFAHFGHWTGDGTVESGTVTLQHGLVTDGTTAVVTGTVSLAGRRINLSLRDEAGAAVDDVGGAIGRPTVQAR
jgi:hypothetical protein